MLLSSWTGVESNPSYPSSSKSLQFPVFSVESNSRAGVALPPFLLLVAPLNVSSKVDLIFSLSPSLLSIFRQKRIPLRFLSTWEPASELLPFLASWLA